MCLWRFGSQQIINCKTNTPFYQVRKGNTLACLCACPTFCIPLCCCSFVHLLCLCLSFLPNLCQTARPSIVSLLKHALLFFSLEDFCGCLFVCSTLGPTPKNWTASTWIQIVVCYLISEQLAHLRDIVNEAPSTGESWDMKCSGASQSTVRKEVGNTVVSH